MRRTARWCLWAALAMCGPPVSVHPLPPANPPVDNALVGSWLGTMPKEKDVLPLEVSAKSAQLMRFDIPRDKDHEGMAFEGHVSVIGAQRFLSLRDVSEKRSAGEGYLFVRYALKDGALTLSLMEDEPVKKAIAAGQLKGKVEGSPASVTITDEAQNVVRFIQKAKSDELWDDPITFKRKK